MQPIWWTQLAPKRLARRLRWSRWLVLPEMKRKMKILENRANAIFICFFVFLVFFGFGFGSADCRPEHGSESLGQGHAGGLIDVLACIDRKQEEVRETETETETETLFSFSLQSQKKLFFRFLLGPWRHGLVARHGAGSDVRLGPRLAHCRWPGWSSPRLTGQNGDPSSPQVEVVKFVAKIARETSCSPFKGKCLNKTDFLRLMLLCLFVYVFVCLFVCLFLLLWKVEKMSSVNFQVIA